MPELARDAAEARSPEAAADGEQPRPPAGAGVRLAAAGHLLRIGRFSLVGLVNTAIDFTVFFVLVYGFKALPVVANIAAFSTALLNSFILNRRFTFGEIAANGSAAVQFVRFTVVNLGALAISTLIVWQASPMIGPVVAKLVAVGFTFAWTYLASYLFVFRDGGKGRSWT